MDKIKRLAGRRSSASSDQHPSSPTRDHDHSTMPASPTSPSSHAKNVSFSQNAEEGVRDQRRPSSEATPAEGMGRLSLDDGQQRQHQHQTKEGLGSKLSSKIVENSQQDHKTLAPVLHERIIHHETELVTRQREVERHIHHVQHHVQPLIEEVHKPEQHYEQTEPVSHQYEEQSNSDEDKAFFASLNKHRSSETHICEERQVIENGETITTTIHYHVHNIIQPVIYRDRPVPASCVKGCTKASEIRSVMDNLNVRKEGDIRNSGRPIHHGQQQRAGEEVHQGLGQGGMGASPLPTEKGTRRAEQAQMGQMGQAQTGLAR